MIELTLTSIIFSSVRETRRNSTDLETVPRSTILPAPVIASDALTRRF